MVIASPMTTLPSEFNKPDDLDNMHSEWGQTNASHHIKYEITR